MKHLLNKALDKGIDYKAYYELSVQQTEEETTSLFLITHSTK